MFLSQQAHGVMNVDVFRDWKRMDEDRTEDVHEGADFLSTCVTNPSILLRSTISHWLMERRRAPPVARVHSTPPPICSRVQLMCCSSFPSPRLHLPPLFTLHLLSDTYSIWFNNSLPLSFHTSLNIHPSPFLHTFSSLLVL